MEKKLPGEVDQFISSYMDLLSDVAQGWNITNPDFVDDGLKLLERSEILFRKPGESVMSSYMYKWPGYDSSSTAVPVQSYPLSPVQASIIDQTTRDIIIESKCTHPEKFDQTAIDIFTFIFSFTDLCWELFLKNELEHHRIDFGYKIESHVYQYKLAEESKPEFVMRASCYLNTAVKNITNMIGFRTFDENHSMIFMTPVLQYAIMDIDMGMTTAYALELKSRDSSSTFIAPGPVLNDIVFVKVEDPQRRLGD